MEHQNLAGARFFGVDSSVKRYARMADRGAPLALKKSEGDRLRKLAEEKVKGHPAATADDRRRFLRSTTGKSISLSALKSLLKRISFGQIGGVGAMERDEWLRAAWRAMGAEKGKALRLILWTKWGRTRPFLS
jgi:hypothetical protein